MSAYEPLDDERLDDERDVSTEEETTPQRILRALTDLVVEGGLTDFSVQEVADRANVSHRTVYRYFPTREALLEGLVAWTEERLVELGGGDTSDDNEELTGYTTHKFAVFDELADLLEANVRFAVGAGLRVKNRERRSARRHRQVRQALPDADQRQVDAIFAVVRLLGSSRTWFVMRDEMNLSGAQSGPICAWAIRTLLDAVRAGNGPDLTGIPDFELTGIAEASDVRAAI